jgi:homogentisate 1,2-dioxygenase
MSSTLAPARGTIDWKMPVYEARTRFFNMYDSLPGMDAFDPIEIVGYPSHRVDLVKAQGSDVARVAQADDELVLVVQGAIRVQFSENGKEVARARAVDGEVLLLPRALTYQVGSDGDEAALFLHFRTREASAVEEA